MKKCIAIGVSSGGFKALSYLFSNLSEKINWPILIVQHIGNDGGEYLCEHLNNLSEIQIHTANDKTQVIPGNAYLAPSGYHMFLDEPFEISLSLDKHVCFARPSIDVMFESAADVCGSHTISIILTGANSDGAKGSQYVKEAGGIVIAQDPKEAETPMMPKSVIKTGCVDHILKLSEIVDFIHEHCATSIT